MTGQRRYRLILLAALGLGSAELPAAEQSVEDFERRIEETGARLEQLDQEIAASRALKGELEKALSAAEQRVGERRQRISGLDRDISRYNQQLEKLESLLADEQRNLARRKQLLADSLRKSQRAAGDNELKNLLQHDDPAMAARLAIYTDYFMQAQMRNIDAQVSALNKVEVARADAMENRNWLNYIKKKASNQYQARQAERDDKQRSIRQVERNITHKTRTVAELKADQARLQTLMEELKAAQVTQSGYFLSGKGSYGLPVAGQIDARFGDVKSVGRIRWNGLYIRARAGDPVRAIAAGEVIYSDWLQGFGMLVILDHGDNYMTLYGGNRDVTVKPGDWADSGATIATVGDSGGQKASGVYFEIRQNAKPVDPEGWISASSGAVSARK